jgi:uncharacterized protein VirK/YbjX
MLRLFGRQQTICIRVARLRSPKPDGERFGLLLKAPTFSGLQRDSVQRLRLPARIDVLNRLLHAAAYSRLDTGPIAIGRMAAHFLRCSSHLETFRHWYGNPANPALQEALELRPALVTLVLHPYLNADWPVERKLATISGHYAMLRGPLAFLRFAPSAPIALAKVGESIQIRLDKLVAFKHEGELTINLFRGDLRLYSLAFTLGQIGSQRVAYAGGLQGVNSPEALETYRSLTHRMHGLRPRDLLVTAFRALCCSMGVARILAISDSKRVCSRSYFKSCTQVFSSYDSAWIDSGGVAMDDGFFELSPRLVHRATEDIPTRKRAQYRRRYAMIDTISRQIDHAVTHAPWPADNHEGTY